MTASPSSPPPSRLPHFFLSFLYILFSFQLNLSSSIFIYLCVHASIFHLFAPACLPAVSTFFLSPRAHDSVSVSISIPGLWRPRSCCPRSARLIISSFIIFNTMTASLKICQSLFLLKLQLSALQVGERTNSVRSREIEKAKVAWFVIGSLEERANNKFKKQRVGRNGMQRAAWL